MTIPGCQFASDNTAGICPEAWAALEEINAGFQPSYGDDPATREACELFRELFETDCDVYFVFTGTAANSLALATLCQSYHGIIAHESAHVATDECGAPEFFSNGAKLIPATGPGAKLDPRELARIFAGRRDLHSQRPRALSVSQATEFGTVYRAQELRELRDSARSQGISMHMDGARFSNAVASLDCAPADLTWRAGVDVLSFGGTKLGMAMTEAVVFFNRELSREFAWRCKQAGQLASKMRFVSAQWRTCLRDRVWLKYARQANTLARELAAGLGRIPGVEILHPVEANGVFAGLPPALHERLHARGWHFYDFTGAGSRFMCSWKTTPEDVAALLNDATGLAPSR
jgi:threonine aldolase